jgi:hypothetical protein
VPFAAVARAAGAGATTSTVNQEILMNRTTAFFASLLLLLSAALVFPSPVVAQKAAPPAVAAATPEPTELEKAQIENIQLRMQLLQEEERSLPQRRNDLIQQYSQIIQRIIAEHPGYTWDSNRGALVPVPKPAEKVSAPAKVVAEQAPAAKQEKK